MQDWVCLFSLSHSSFYVAFIIDACVCVYIIFCICFFGILSLCSYSIMLLYVMCVCLYGWICACVCAAKTLWVTDAQFFFVPTLQKQTYEQTVPLFFFLSLFLYVCGRLFHFNCLVHCFDGSLDSAFTKRNKGSPMLPEINVWRAILPGHVDASLLPCLKRVTTLTFIRLESYFSEREKSSGKCWLSH